MARALLFLEKEIQTTIKLTTPNQLIQLILFPSDIQITHGDATESTGPNENFREAIFKLLYVQNSEEF